MSKLSEAVITGGIDVLRADRNVAKKWLAYADLMRSEGITADLMRDDKDFRKDFLDQVVMLSFTKTEQSIYATPSLGLSEEQKVTKRWVTTERASRYGKVVRHLAKAEAEEAMTDDERGARKVASLAARLKADLERWIGKVEKAEAVTFSATQMVKLLKDASALIK
jgi:hypothetical protein